MKPSGLRWHGLLVVLVYLLGFSAPWERLLPGQGANTAWLTLASLLARSRWLTLSESTVFLTALGLAFAVGGTLLRLWSATRSAAARPDGGPGWRLAGPLGLWLLSVPAALLMPWPGALFCLAAMLGLELRQAGVVAPDRLQPGSSRRWLQALLAESYGIAFTACFAVLAWRYNAQLLVRAMLICFGLSLVLKAALPGLATDQGAIEHRA